MGSKPAVSLYDFIYKDLSKLSSYYSQIFKGKLTKVEKTSQTEDSKKTTLGSSIKILAAKQNTEEVTSEEIKTTFDPHDSTVTDVLSFLMSNNYVTKNLATAKNGDLVLASGAMLFMDKYIFELSITGMESIMVFGNPKQKQNKDLKNFTTTMKNFLSKMPFEAAYLFKSKDLYISGTIRQQFLDEAVSSYYIKYGSSGMSNVFMIGIKHDSSEIFDVENSTLFGYGQGMIDAFKNLIFPPNALSITPIAIFRKVTQQSSPLSDKKEK